MLNACEGSRSSRIDPFAGVAQTLIQQGVPAVIAMQFEITDQAAITFAEEFYASTADGYPVDAALTAARKAIFAAGSDSEWGTPVLYMRAPDGQLFSVNREAARLAEEERQRAEASRLAKKGRPRAEAARLAEEERQSTSERFVLTATKSKSLRKAARDHNLPLLGVGSRYIGFDPLIKVKDAMTEIPALRIAVVGEYDNRSRVYVSLRQTCQEWTRFPKPTVCNGQWTWRIERSAAAYALSLVIESRNGARAMTYTVTLCASAFTDIADTNISLEAITPGGTVLDTKNNGTISGGCGAILSFTPARQRFNIEIDTTNTSYAALVLRNLNGDRSPQTINIILLGLPPGSTGQSPSTTAMLRNFLESQRWTPEEREAVYTAMDTLSFLKKMPGSTSRRIRGGAEAALRRIGINPDLIT